MNNYKAVCFIVVVFIAGIKAFSWKSCGETGDPIKVVNLAGHIDKSLVLNMDGTVKVATNLTSPIKASLQVWKKFFWGWTLIPCVDNFGSCNYEDVCDMSPYSNDNCPAEFTANNIPCACPILQGRYTAKGFPINLKLLPKWIEKGTYKLKINLLKDSKNLLCLLVSETV